MHGSACAWAAPADGRSLGQYPIFSNVYLARVIPRPFARLQARQHHQRARIPRSLLKCILGEYIELAFFSAQLLIQPHFFKPGLETFCGDSSVRSVYSKRWASGWRVGVCYG
jgi:hypothetical protein